MCTTKLESSGSKKRAASDRLNLKWQIFLEKDGAGMDPEQKMAATTCQHKMAVATCLEMKKMGWGGGSLRCHFTFYFLTNGDRSFRLTHNDTQTKQ